MYVIYLEEQTMERWYVMMKKADFSSIGAKYNISPGHCPPDQKQRYYRR